MLAAGLEESNRGIVVDRLGEHRLDETAFIRDFGNVGQKLAKPSPALAVLGEFERGARKRNHTLVRTHACQPLSMTNTIGQGLAVKLVEQWLVVEKVLLGWAPSLKQIDDSLGFWRVVEF